MATLRIFSGGAPKEIFLQLTPRFEGASSHKIEYVFAVMSALRDKLSAGEKADVLVIRTAPRAPAHSSILPRAMVRCPLGLQQCI